MSSPTRRRRTLVDFVQRRRRIDRVGDIDVIADQDFLLFEGAHEALADRVVRRHAGTAHARVLRSAIGTVNEATLRLTPLQRHPQRRRRQIGAIVMRRRPADTTPAEHVPDDCHKSSLIPLMLLHVAIAVNPRKSCACGCICTLFTFEHLVRAALA
jgi:hypothetical protein